MTPFEKTAALIDRYVTVIGIIVCLAAVVMIAVAYWHG